MPHVSSSRLLGSLLLLAFLAVPSVASTLDHDSLRTGRATFYRDKHGRGACALPRPVPWDTLYAAINRSDWRNSLVCGACAWVFGESDSVLVRISDRCGGCKPGGLDLSPAAFRKLAPLGRGRIDISWRFAPCPESSLVVSRTRGSSVHWSSLQTWGLPWPIESLSVRSDSVSIDFSRRRHNHFTARKVPSLPWTIRTVDVLGRERIDSLVDLAPGSTLGLDSVRGAADPSPSTEASGLSAPGSSPAPPNDGHGAAPDSARRAILPD